MISEHTIYCVGCSSIVEVDKAEMIFRTGYYKVSMHLGICIACQSNDKQLDKVCMLEPTEGSHLIERFI